MHALPPTASPVAVVAGHICLDIIPTFDPKQGGGGMPAPGKLVNVGPAVVSTGGAVSNTGLALHRLGIATRLMGKIGDDLFGRAILDVLRRRDPALAAGMIVAGSPSSYTVVISPPGIDRSFLHCPGANDTFGAEDVATDQIADATIFHFGYPPIMARMFARGGAELEELFRRVKGAGVITSLDMAHVDIDAPAGHVDWAALLQRTLPHVDFFLPSLDEAFFMLDRQRCQSASAEMGDLGLAVYGGGALLDEMSSRLLAMGVAVVGLKLGDQGIYLRTTEDTARLAQLGLAPTWRGRELLAPTFQVQVVGTTGAGDCAVAGFLAALLRGLGPEAALTAAAGAGACNVEVADAISGIPTWDDLQARIAGGWPRLPLRVALDGWAQQPAGLWAGPHDDQLVLHQ
jgi:sugar/nucleoside kinase (ribokinase family)